MATGSRRAGIATGPSVGPRLVPQGVAPWAPAGVARRTELRFVVIELIPNQSAQSPAADGTGAMEAVFQVPSDRVWKVERITVSSTSTVATAASVYVNAADPANLVDLTPAGNGDVADETNPIFVPAGNVLRVVWTGASVGAIGTVRIQGYAGVFQQVTL